MGQGNRSKILNMIIAVVMAIALWAYCVAEINPTSDVPIKNIPIVYEGEESLTDSGLAIISDRPEAMNLTVGGQRGVLSKLKSTDFTVKCDISSLMEGENRISLSINCPEGVTIERQSIKNIVLVVEDIVTQSKAIVGAVINQDADEDRAEIVSISKSKIKVTGPKSRVEDVSYVRAVVDATLLGNTAVILDCPLEAVDGNGDVIEEVTLGRAYVTCKAILKNPYWSVQTTDQGDTSESKDEGKNEDEASVQDKDDTLKDKNGSVIKADDEKNEGTQTKDTEEADEETHNEGDEASEATEKSDQEVHEDNGGDSSDVLDNAEAETGDGQTEVTQDGGNDTSDIGSHESNVKSDEGQSDSL